MSCFPPFLSKYEVFEAGIYRVFDAQHYSLISAAFSVQVLQLITCYWRVSNIKF